MKVISGEIVPVPDATGGVGAAVVVSRVFNAMWESAQNKADASLEVVGEALDFADQAPTMSASSVGYDYALPDKPELPDISGDSDKTETMFRTYNKELWDKLVDAFAGYMTKYFPEPAYYKDALAWCGRAITAGGTGIRAPIEQQLWERNRARIMSDYASAVDQAENEWANRRFPLPPGSLVGQLNSLRTNSFKELAASSRDIAVKSFEQEIENVRFAVDQLLNFRIAALDAANKYIGALTGATDTAVKLATGLASLKGEMARALTAMYQAEISALEPKVRMAITDAELAQKASEKNIDASLATLDAKVKSAMAAAQMLATQAAAGLNAIGARAGISGQDSSSV